MANFYISDTHLGHANVLRLSKRDFANIDEMDEAIISNWNSVVTDNDDIWIGGDFCYKSSKNPLDYLKRLNGIKHLIIGNHDGFMLKQQPCRKMFESIDQLRIIEDGGQRIVLCHYPMVEWEGYFRGVLHFYGHIHNNTDNQTYQIVKNIKNAYNMGTDILGHIPRRKEDVIALNEAFNKIH